MRFAIILATLFLTACASNNQNKVAEAVVTPLNDLNLAHGAIPDLLITAQRAPYAASLDMSCAGLAADIHALDELLGTDIDAPSTASNPGLIERGGNLVVGAVQKTAEGVIPFRGWVRKLSGAERHSKQVSAAIAAGTSRRAFLKGIIWAKNCPQLPVGGQDESRTPETVK